jgi:predicted DNA-binding antitoxin AbrB/MazE fold protein
MDQELQRRGHIKPQDQVVFVSGKLKPHRALDLPEGEEHPKRTLS